MYWDTMERILYHGIRATLGKTITACSIYLPPTMVFNSTDLENLTAQLPPPILLLGDF